MVSNRALNKLTEDYEALALRNQTMADAFHQVPIQHHIRHMGLRVLASIPFPLRPVDPNQQRILLIRPDHLGDVLLTTPAIHALRATFINAQIHTLVGSWSANVLESMSEVDVILTVDFPGFTRGAETKWTSPYRYAYQTAKNLRKIGYSQTIIFRPDHWWGAWVAQLAGIRHRIGYATKDTQLFLTEKVDDFHGHVVEKNLRLVERLTGQHISPENAPLVFNPTDNHRGYIQGYLEEWNIAHDDAVFCIHPGSGAWVKLWDIQKWADIADTLAERLNAHVIFTGSEQEVEMIRAIIKHMNKRAVIMAGDTELGHLAALYERAEIVLGPDSGPLHLAVAVKTPTVTLYGPADPIEFGPWGNHYNHQVLTSPIGCRPCKILDWSDDDPIYHPCVRDITITQVLNATQKALSNTN